MRLKKEKNIDIFNNDIRDIGSYAYTSKKIHSALIATKRQSDEIIRIIKKYFRKNIKILDIGCGDEPSRLSFIKELVQN